MSARDDGSQNIFSKRWCLLTGSSCFHGRRKAGNAGHPSGGSDRDHCLLEPPSREPFLKIGLCHAQRLRASFTTRDPDVLKCLTCGESALWLVLQELTDKINGRFSVPKLLQPTNIILATDGVAKALLVCVRHERREASQQDVEDDPHTPHVCSEAITFLSNHLRSNVARRAAHVVQNCARFADCRETKVSDLDDCVGRIVSQEEVLGLEITMNDVLLMEIDQSA
mmetsp:Transcript_63556/g.150595  ORF Transcript_63556/g.150595 Transcript_63556/m.150595 type:complete len:225 (-) Transcript_63556:651-1325(-)